MARRNTWGRNVPIQGQADNEGRQMAASLSEKSGSTRGKNPRPIKYMVFDLSKPETLPKDLKEFMEVTKVTDEKDVLSLLVDGFNQDSYSKASDEIGEFINDEWDDETQSQFRLSIRNTSKLTNMSIEDTVNLLKPAIEKGWQAKLAAKKAAAEEAAKAPATT